MQPQFLLTWSWKLELNTDQERRQRCQKNHLSSLPIGGVKWNPQIPYDGFKTCPHCGCDLYFHAEDRGKNWFCYMVGFSSTIPRKTSRSKIVGIFILDCPRCQTKFWHHASLLNCENARGLCPYWPKGENGQPL